MLTLTSASRVRKAIVALLALTALVVSSACIDYESGVAFNKDMTGKASFKMTMDLGPFVNNMVSAMSARGGGPPPDEMVSQLKTELATQLSGGMFDVEQLKKSLPAGVTLADSSQKMDELKIIMSFSFAFTDVTKLPLIELPPPTIQGANSIKAQQLKPFESLVFTIDDTTVTITEKSKAAETPTVESLATKAAAQSAVSQAKAQLDQLGMGDMLKGLSLRMAFKFDVPQTVIEQNATRKEGQTYIWEVKLDNFDSIDKMPDPPNIKLKFKK